MRLSAAVPVEGDTETRERVGRAPSGACRVRALRSLLMVPRSGRLAQRSATRPSLARPGMCTAGTNLFENSLAGGTILGAFENAAVEAAATDGFALSQVVAERTPEVAQQPSLRTVRPQRATRRASRWAPLSAGASARCGPRRRSMSPRSRGRPRRCTRPSSCRPTSRSPSA